MFYAYIIIDILKIKKHLASHESDNHLNNTYDSTLSFINFPKRIVY